MLLSDYAYAIDKTTFLCYNKDIYCPQNFVSEEGGVPYEKSRKKDYGQRHYARGILGDAKMIATKILRYMSGDFSYKNRFALGIYPFGTSLRRNIIAWRKGQDSNLRGVNLQVVKTSAINHSGTLPRTIITKSSSVVKSALYQAQPFSV